MSDVICLLLQAPLNTVRFRAFGTPKLLEYFGIRAETGDVYVSKSLQLDTQKNFQVKKETVQ